MTAPEPPPAPEPEPPIALAPLPAPSPGRAVDPGAADVRESAGAHQSPVVAAVTRLDGVHQLPLHEQPDVYQAVHTELQNALAAIDDA